MKFLKRLVCIGTVGLLMYSGLMMGAPFYKFYVFKSDVEDVLQFSVETDEQMKQLILNKAKEYSVPLAEKDMELISENGRYKLKAKWSETVNILDRYKRKFDFAFELPEVK